VVFRVQLASLFAVMGRMEMVPVRSVRVMRCLLMIFGFVMTSRLPVVLGCGLMVMGCFLVMLGDLIRVLHGLSPCAC
jgi:hypothetical protein